MNELLERLTLLEAILDAYPYEIVCCDRSHTVRYMNRVARARYSAFISVGGSLFNCHNESSRAKIERFLERADAGEGEMFEVLNKATGEREFFVPVRDPGGRVIGYFERHENYWSPDDPAQPVKIPGFHSK